MGLEECTDDALSAAGQHRLEHLLQMVSLAHFGSKWWASRALGAKGELPGRESPALPDVGETVSTLDAVAWSTMPVPHPETVNRETAAPLQDWIAGFYADAHSELNVQELHDKLLVVVVAQQSAAAKQAATAAAPEPPQGHPSPNWACWPPSAPSPIEAARALEIASQQRRLTEGRPLSRALKEQEEAAEAAVRARAEKEAAAEAAAQAKAELDVAHAAATSESQRAWLLFEVEEVRREEARRRRPIPEGVPPPLVVPVKRTSRALRMRTKLKANPPQQVQRLWVLRQERRVAWS